MPFPPRFASSLTATVEMSAAIKIKNQLKKVSVRDLCRTIPGIELGDILVQPQKGQITRLQITRTSMNISDERVFFVIDGLRFRKDVTTGKRMESVWVDFQGSSTQ